MLVDTHKKVYLEIHVLKLHIGPRIMPVPRVIRHTARPQLSAIASHETSSRSCKYIYINAHYLSQLFRTVYVALQYS